MRARAGTRRAETNAEVGQTKVKYFRCSKRGHIAKNCLLVKKEPTTRRVTTEDEDQPTDPWVLSVTADDTTRPTLSLQVWLTK